MVFSFGVKFTSLIKVIYFLVNKVFLDQFRLFFDNSFSILRFLVSSMSISASSSVSSATSPPAFSEIARDCAFGLANQLCLRLHAAKGMAGFLSGKSLRKGGSGLGPAFAAAFAAAARYIPPSDFLTASDIYEDSAVGLICATFDLPSHSWCQIIHQPTDLIRSVLGLPEDSGPLSDLFQLIAPMVPADHTALPEVRDVGWHVLRFGHPDSVAGQLRQSLVIGFVLALALRGLSDPDCLVLPAPVVEGLLVRVPASTSSSRMGSRVDLLEASVASLQTAVASAELASAARSAAAEARSEAMEARLLAAFLAGQSQPRAPVLPGPVMAPQAGTPCPANSSAVPSSGGIYSDSDDEYSDHEDSFASAAPPPDVPVSHLPSYLAAVHRIRQESGYAGAVPATISHIAYALVTDGVLLATIVGGIFSVKFRFTSKSNQSKARSLLVTELFQGSHSPADSSATMMSAPRDCWPSSFAQFPAMEAEQARLLDARWAEMGRAGTQSRHVSWYADTRSHLQTFFVAARSLECIVRSSALADSKRHLSAFAFYKLFVLHQWNLMCTSGDFSTTTSWPSLWASHFGHHLSAPPSAASMREQLLFLAISCSACAEIGYASPFCFSCKIGFASTRLSQDQFTKKFEAWKTSSSGTDKSAEAFRKSAAYKTSAAAAAPPTAPELWYARLALDQSLIPALPARIDSV